MNETQAIRLCLKHRDPVGFEFLVRKYRREAYYHAFAFVGNTEDAADACQESFGRAFAAIPELKTLDRFYPWFYRILRNCCLNILRRRRTALNYARDNSASIRNESTDENPASSLAKREEAQAVRKALDSLDFDDREILSLKYIQGHRYQEIAHLLEIPRGTVMSRLFHARKAFRAKYLNYGKPEYKQPRRAHHE